MTLFDSIMQDINILLEYNIEIIYYPLIILIVRDTNIIINTIINIIFTNDCPFLMASLLPI